MKVLKELDESRASEHPGLTLEALRVLTGISPDQLDDVLSALLEHGLVGLLSGSKSKERFVMICNPEAIGAEVVASALWFDPALASRAKGLPAASRGCWLLFLPNTCKMLRWLIGWQAAGQTSRLPLQTSQMNRPPNKLHRQA
ncbi:MAG: hypothetical protein HC848_08955 [Limnobacter sp.]|nr:hypothetical protein [Limnobacter sp.]